MWQAVWVPRLFIDVYKRQERVLERFLEKAGEEEFRQLRKSVERQKILLQTGDSREFLREDGKFHSVFYHRAGLDYSYQILSAHGGDYHKMCIRDSLSPGTYSGRRDIASWSSNDYDEGWEYYF